MSTTTIIPTATFSVAHFSDGWAATPNNTSHHAWKRGGDCNRFATEKEAREHGLSQGWTEVDEDGRLRKIETVEEDRAYYRSIRID